MTDARLWTEVDFDLIYEGRKIAAARRLGIAATSSATVTRDRHDEQVIAAELPFKDLETWLELGTEAVSQSNKLFEEDSQAKAAGAATRRADIESGRPTAKGFAPPSRRSR